MSRGGHGNESSYCESANQGQFHGILLGRKVTRMQIVPLGMPGRYNFRVIIT